MSTDNTLINYFENSWKPNYDRFTHSGWELLNKVSPSESILDIGCGYNLFKEHWGTRLLGIDPSNDAADMRVSIEDFDPKGIQWDVVLCLGSLNFGDAATVYDQVHKAVSLCRPGGRIYWRQNPGIGDHPWQGVDAIQFFPWSVELNYEWAALLGCTVKECKWDDSRIYAEWIKN
jgi:SAM-dependent methyltransferase